MLANLKRKKITCLLQTGIILSGTYCCVILSCPDYWVVDRVFSKTFWLSIILRYFRGCGRRAGRCFRLPRSPRCARAPPAPTSNWGQEGNAQRTKASPAQAPPCSLCFASLGVPAFKAELEAGGGGGSRALISGQRNLARRAATKPRSWSALERAGAQLPVRAAAPGLCPGVLGAAGAPSTPEYGHGSLAPAALRRAWRSVPPAEPGKFDRSEHPAFPWVSGFKPQRGMNPPHFPVLPAATGPSLSSPLRGRGQAALPARGRCGRRGALCGAAAPSGPRAGRAGGRGRSLAGLGCELLLATAKPAPHLAAWPDGSLPFAVTHRSTIFFTRCFSSLNTCKLVARSVFTQLRSFYQRWSAKSL